MENSNWNNQRQASRSGSTFSHGTSHVEAASRVFMQHVYGWMTLGLLITALFAYLTFNSEFLFSIVSGMGIWALIIAELGLVFVISGMINKLSPLAAKGLFALYSALNGLTLSVILMAYTQSSVYSTFLITAGTFGLMSVYGMVTKKDLTNLGSLLMMGLVGIIIASLVNVFIGSSGLSMIISYVGVLIFTGLVAYDTQKLKNISYSVSSVGAGNASKMAILGALSLYLDFINLFIMLLRVLGNRR
ncbi:Bax inhibitor-1/YccA family protein [Persicobacter psychrovividus]|uniref:Membrane protein n=1 Tax=Persicobacter psychrovividus TaxID=387638 RepID=A0ABM7VKQ1_9BACT|nr:membrane protein [Persicobacter psychrovividus]